MIHLQRFWTIYSLLPRYLRIRLNILVAFMMVFAVIELLGVSSSMPFVMLVSNPDEFLGNPYVAPVVEYLGISTTRDALLYGGGVFLCTLGLLNSFKLLSMIIVSHVTQKIRVHIVSRLFDYYLNQEFLYYSLHNSGVLQQKIGGEGNRVARLMGVIISITINVFTVCFIVGGLVFVSPGPTLIAFGIMGCSYVVIQKLISPKVNAWGRELSERSLIYGKIIHESFLGVHDLQLSRSTGQVLKAFEKNMWANSKMSIYIQTVTQFPRHLIEWMLFFLLVLFVVLNSSDGSQMDKMLPLLSLYAVAGIRILPCINSIYSYITTMNSNSNAYKVLGDDLIKALERYHEKKPFSKKRLPLHQNIAFSDVSFSYREDQKKNTLSHISIDIPKGSHIGIIGGSGSGKSSFVYLLSGLTRPKEGSIFIDDHLLNDETIELWQNAIGYVSQEVMLMDDSIASNIALGFREDHIDNDKIRSICKSLLLDDYISSLPDQYETIVGERGAQLSGGQRQRIGIARALYRDPSVLIFDEATSALDGQTEQTVIESIRKYRENLTVIMVAHRLTTIRHCDTVYLFKSGSIKDSGSFDDLYERHKQVRAMAGDKP